MDKLLFTTVEAAKSLSISRSQVYGLIQNGELDSIKVGNCRRIPAEALRHYIDKQLQAQQIA
jgi:excisionase family DNA binding protein